MKKIIKKLSKKDFDSFVSTLINDKTYEIIGVKTKRERFVFEPLESADELRLDYDITILPPKKYFLPQYETLMEFNLEKTFDVKESIPHKPMVIIGIHPYDIIALEQTDKIYLDEHEDKIYKKRRQDAVIIGIDIQNVSERSFAASMNTHITDTGFDLMLTDLGGTFAVTVGSKKGQRLLDKYAKTTDATKNDIRKIQKIREKLPSKYKRNVVVNKKNWSAALMANYNHPIWKEKAKNCLSCGSCIMVCPTCFCYDVKDETSLNLKDGRRIRTWDGCLLRDFTKIGSGEVFRKNVEDRYRHRFFRKGNYLLERYGFVACVGCGRCGAACIPDIADPCDMMNNLTQFDASCDTSRFFIKKKETSRPSDDRPLHVPRSATVKRIKKLTETEKLFEIELDDKKPLDHIPGQFVEISVFGIGEAPISISSAPHSSSSFELTIRKVGNVTTKLFSMNVGDKVGIRGPFGNGFDIKALEKKHLLFVSGGLGMAPMRSLIQYVLDKKHRNKFKYVKILYGTKKPCEALFVDEIKQWEKCPNVTCRLTVDSCSEDECWVGSVGLITTLFPKIKTERIDPKNTIAVVIGPPIMYKFVIKCLQTLGIPDKNIMVSLERRMKCGVGKCGHCQINGVYVCKEGPVFNYSEIKNLPEAFE